MRLFLVTFLMETAFGQLGGSPGGGEGIGGGGWKMPEKDRVRLEDVEVITLTRGAWTNGRYLATVFLEFDNCTSQILQLYKSTAFLNVNQTPLAGGAALCPSLPVLVAAEGLRSMSLNQNTV